KLQGTSLRFAILDETTSLKNAKIDTLDYDALKERHLLSSVEVTQIFDTDASDSEPRKGLLEEARTSEGIKDLDLRTALAENIATPSSVLSRLASDLEWQVRVRVALNGAISKRSAQEILHDSDERVRGSFCNSPTISKRQLKQLS